MKIGWRIALFLTGLGLLFFSWRKVHNEMLSLQNPGTANAVGTSQILVVVGGFVTLMAFAPSPEMLSRWMSLKRPKKPQPAHFKRRRQRG
jgi:hypothetical protein